MGRAAGRGGSGDEEARGGGARRARADATGACRRGGQGETTADGARTGPSDRGEPREAARSGREETGGAPRGDHGPRTGCDGEGGDDWEPGDGSRPRGEGAQGETLGPSEGFLGNQRPRGRCGEARGRPERDRIGVGKKRDRIEQGRARPGEEKGRGRPRR